MVIVTGGFGYIGSHLVMKLISTGRTVLVIDRDIRRFDMIGHLINDSMPEFAHNFNIIQRDLGSDDELIYLDAIQKLVDKTSSVEAIFDLAANKSVPESLKFPDKYLVDNVKATEEVLKLAEIFNARVVFASTAAVYSGNNSMIDVMNLTPYAKGKFISEMLVNHANSSNRILRFFNPIGCAPRLSRVSTDFSVMDYLLDALHTGDNFTIFGTDYDTPDGTCIRDFIDVRDLVDFMFDQLKSPFGGVTDLGSGTGTSVAQLATIFNDILEDYGQPTIQIEAGPARHGDVVVSRVENPTNKTYLTVSESVQSEIDEYYRKNPTMKVDNVTEPEPKSHNVIYSFDFDGVLTRGDIIEIAHKIKSQGNRVIVVTGRCVDESDVVFARLKEEGLDDIPVYFNPTLLSIRGNDNESRHISAQHKHSILKNFVGAGIEVYHWEDDPIQIDAIKAITRDRAVYEFGQAPRGQKRLNIIHVPNTDGEYFGK